MSLVALTPTAAVASASAVIGRPISTGLFRMRRPAMLAAISIGRDLGIRTGIARHISVAVPDAIDPTAEINQRTQREEQRGPIHQTPFESIG